MDVKTPSRSKRTASKRSGLIGLARNGDGAAGRARSNKLMQWRVGLQGAALVLFVLLLSLLNSTR